MKYLNTQLPFCSDLRFHTISIYLLAILETYSISVYYHMLSFEHFVGNFAGAIARKNLVKINEKLKYQFTGLPPS